MRLRSQPTRPCTNAKSRTTESKLEPTCARFEKRPLAMSSSALRVTSEVGGGVGFFGSKAFSGVSGVQGPRGWYSKATGTPGGPVVSPPA